MADRRQQQTIASIPDNNTPAAKPFSYGFETYRKWNEEECNRMDLSRDWKSVSIGIGTISQPPPRRLVERKVVVSSTKIGSCVID